MGLLELSALELGQKIQSGEVSVREATEAALEAIARENEANNAFITVLREQALAGGGNDSAENHLRRTDRSPGRGSHGH